MVPLSLSLSHTVLIACQVHWLVYRKEAEWTGSCYLPMHTNAQTHTHNTTNTPFSCQGKVSCFCLKVWSNPSAIKLCPHDSGSLKTTPAPWSKVSCLPWCECSEGFLGLQEFRGNSRFICAKRWSCEFVCSKQIHLIDKKFLEWNNDLGWS